MRQPQDVIPYFEGLFARLQANEPETSAAFGRHVHWGYWKNPAHADGSASDYGRAAEEMCRRVCDAAGIGNGQRILDVGCGFGGTIASLNERFSNLQLTGVNIDVRQLDRAQSTVRASNRNTIAFIEGNAMALPFPAASFDVVLAVECIFHFPERERFLAEAARVLRPNGVLVVSDFVPNEDALPMLRAYNPAADNAMQATYGTLKVDCSSAAYHHLGQRNGLMMLKEDDISVHTLPTYAFLRGYLSRIDERHADLFQKATGQLEKTCRKGWLRYTILTFRKLTLPIVMAA